MRMGFSAVAMFLLLLLSACSTGGSTTPPPPPQAAPSIRIFASGANNDSGGRCLLFVAAPSENLQMLSVNISHEIGINIGTVNLGGSLVIPTERIALQPTGICYNIVSGEYRFSFTVTRPNSPTQVTVNAVYTQANASSVK